MWMIQFTRKALKIRFSGKALKMESNCFFIFIFKFILELIKTLCRMKSTMGKMNKNTRSNCGKKAPKQKINPEIFEANDVIFDWHNVDACPFNTINM